MKSYIDKEEVCCALCESCESIGVAMGVDREYPTSTDTFSIVSCRGCGLRYLNPRPKTHELSTIYPANYHAYNIRAAGSPHKSLPYVTRLRHKIYSRRFRKVFSKLTAQSSVELLDVGCGDGWMLDLYKLAAPCPITTYGVDFNAEVCKVAESFGHQTFCSRFEDLQLTGRFNIVNLSHVIEHVSDPLLIARKSFEVLRPGGLFVLETPNTDTFDARIFEKGAWGAYHIPRHWNLFDESTLRKLGEKAGFKFLEVIYNPAPVHWVWSLNNLSVQAGGVFGAIGQNFFSPLDVFSDSFKAFLLLSFGTVLDLFLKLTTGKTSNMMMIFKKES